MNQPIAMICRETIIANFLSLEWKITARDSNMQDELKPTIRYYTKLLENGGYNPNNFGMDYSGWIEWLLTDLLDLPFGAGMEIGRRDDSPGGRVIWLKPLDGGTLFPTLNKDYPVVQYYSTEKLIPFPEYAIARMYISPRTEILREGWGMAPPEKVILALEMLLRGDRYWASLLLDTPPAGILDLGDMESTAALEWVKSFRESQLGNPMEAFKIPVLYEHTTDVKFIPFGKPPADILYDRISMKYASIVCAGYGLYPSDIGLSMTSNGGETLAGSIREERKTRKGLSRIKKKVKGFIESFLPDELQFNFVDLDDELSVALGRARLATATSWSQFLDKGVFTPDEARLQTIADGLITINLPEKVPAEAKKAKASADKQKQANAQVRQMGKPVPVSSGGQGEVKKISISVEKSKYFDAHLKRLVTDLTKVFAPILIESSEGLGEDEIFLLRSYVDDSLFGDIDLIGTAEIIKSAWGRKSWMRLDVGEELKQELEDVSTADILSKIEENQISLYENGETDSPELDEIVLNGVMERLHRVNWEDKSKELIENIGENIKSFIGKSVLSVVKELLLSEDVFDVEEKSGYDSIVSRVYKAMNEHFDEFSSACIELEVQNILNKIEMEMLDEQAN